MSRIGVIGTGEFGRQVRKRIARHFPEQIVASLDQPRDDELAAAETIVAVLWRPSAALCESLDEAAHRLGKPWLPVVLDNPVLRIGPLIRPTEGPCFRCFTRRRRQQMREHDVDQAVLASYDADPRCGPIGHLPQHESLAAGLIGLALSQPHGFVYSASLVSTKLTRHEVLACHGCDRCGDMSALAASAKDFDDLCAALAASTAEWGVAA